MANMHTIAALKADFAKGGPNEIIANGRQEISGPRLNNVLLNIIDTLDYVLAPEGVGIELIEQNEDSSLTFTLTDGSTFTTIPLKGEKGDPPVITADEDGNIYADGQFVTSIIKDTLAQVVSDVDVAVARANEAAQDALQKAGLAEAAAATASTAAAGADAKAALAQAAADNADAKAALAAAAAGTANTAAAGADTSASNADAKATLADTAATAATAAAASATAAAATAVEKAALADTAAATANAAAEAADEAREGIQEDLDKKANKDGWYQTLTSGLSENLVDTKGAGTEQEFTDRTSCGEESIADDGSGIIKELRGNSLAWNQRLKIKNSSASATSNNVTLVDNRDGSFSISTTAAGASAYTSFPCVSTDFIEGHKYLLTGCPNGGSASTFMLSANNTYASNGGQDLGGGVIFTALTGIGLVNLPQIRVFKDIVITTPITFWPKLTDLTLMFGAGKEPATVEEFQALYHELYYPQNDGTILNNAAATLITDGYNQYDPQTGKALVYAGHQYQITGTFTGLTLNGAAVTPDASGLFTPSEDGELVVTGGNDTDTCVHLTWSGYRNGEYEPYWKRVTGVDMRKIYGKLNGQGEMVQVFPDGGRSAGNVYDVAEIFEKKEADVRLGVVDMGDLSWTYDPNRTRFTSGVLSAAALSAKSISSAYVFGANGYDKTFFIGNNRRVLLSDSAYTDTAVFKAAVTGQKIVFELATPLHYTDLMYSEDGGQTFVDIPTVYKIADFGTERIEPLVDAQGNPVTAPFRAVIKYSDDFTRTLVNLPKNYDTTGGLDDLLAELSSVLGTALNGTLSIARGAYNTATKKYAWSVSFTPNE